MYCIGKTPSIAESGQACLSSQNINGVFTKCNDCWRIALDLHIVDLGNRAILFRPNNLMTLARIIPNYYFGINLDEERVIVGRNIWDQWREMYNPGPEQIIPHGASAPGFLPTYDQMMTLASNNGQQFGNRYRIRIAFGSENFSWQSGYSFPLLHLEFGNNIDADSCIIGREILKYGLLCFEERDNEKYSYYFPRYHL